MRASEPRPGGWFATPYPFLGLIVFQLALIGWNVYDIRGAVTRGRACDGAPVPVPTRALASNHEALAVKQERLAALVRGGWQVAP